MTYKSTKPPPFVPPPKRPRTLEPAFLKALMIFQNQPELLDTPLPAKYDFMVVQYSTGMVDTVAKFEIAGAPQYYNKATMEARIYARTQSGRSYGFEKQILEKLNYCSPEIHDSLL